MIIHNQAGYVRTWEDVHIYPQTFPALRELVDCPLKIMIVSDQSAIHRGLTTHAAADDIHARLQEIILKADQNLLAVTNILEAKGWFKG